MPQDQIGFYIELKVEPENGHVYVHSKQVPGLHLLGRCFQDMKPGLEAAIKRLYQDNHRQEVQVIWLASAESFPIATSVLEKVAVYPVKRAA